MLVRALTGVQVVSGIPMPLFGFIEIMRNAGPDSETRPRDRHSQRPPHDPV
jgi:hypothetical protein